MIKMNFAAVTSTVFAFTLLAGCTTGRGEYSGNIKDDSKPNYFTEIQKEVEEIDLSDSLSVEPGFSAEVEEVGEERKNSILEQRIIYFDYDKSLVDNEYLAIINAHADYLLRNPNRLAILQGNTDDRGSNEYNLALGQRRADAVRDIILKSGVSPLQVESISFGEEVPAVSGQNEAAWEKNRRVEIRYSDE